MDWPILKYQNHRLLNTNKMMPFGQVSYAF